MDISSAVGVAAGIEGARNAGIQQASSSANTDQVDRDTKKQKQDLDLKRTDVVPGVSDTNTSSKTHKVNVLT
jgi:hypothetical protein